MLYPIHRGDVGYALLCHAFGVGMSSRFRPDLYTRADFFSLLFSSLVPYWKVPEWAYTEDRKPSEKPLQTSTDGLIHQNIPTRTYSPYLLCKLSRTL